MTICEMDLNAQQKDIKCLLEKAEIRLESGLDGMLGVYENDVLLAVGGWQKDVLKCIAVSQEARGDGLTNLILSELLERIRENGFFNAYLFTKPTNERFFSSVGFHTVAKTEKAMLMESRRNGINDWLNTIDKKESNGEAGAIVMNANPMTLGHLQLIKQACRCCATLYLFVVEEDCSEVPFRDRIAIIRKETAELPNVLVYGGGPYLISRSTFPTYFLKRLDDGAYTHAELDATIFAERIAPALHISIRYAGSEPFDMLTAAYNEQLRNVLQYHGIRFVEIPRFQAQKEPISASRVRTLWHAGRLADIQSLVPEATFQYLKEHPHGSSDILP